MTSLFAITTFCTCLVREAALSSWVSQCCSLRLSLPRKLGGSLRRRSQSRIPIWILFKPNTSKSSRASASCKAFVTAASAPCETIRTCSTKIGDVWEPKQPWPASKLTSTLQLSVWRQPTEQRARPNICGGLDEEWTPDSQYGCPKDPSLSLNDVELARSALETLTSDLLVSRSSLHLCGLLERRFAARIPL